jgi:hypothetical protein
VACSRVNFTFAFTFTAKGVRNSQVHATAMFLLVVVRNREIRCWASFSGITLTPLLVDNQSTCSEVKMGDTQHTLTAWRPQKPPIFLKASKLKGLNTPIKKLILRPTRVIKR